MNAGGEGGGAAPSPAPACARRCTPAFRQAAPRLADVPALCMPTCTRTLTPPPPPTARPRPTPHAPPPPPPQASNLTGFFEHLMAPGAAVEHFSHDMHDLPVRARALLAELAAGPARLRRMTGARAGGRGARAAAGGGGGWGSPSWLRGDA